MKTHTGFTLIEVLIAMIILALGLLGLAGLQTFNIRNNLLAYQRGQAIQLLYDMSDRIRANTVNSGSYLTISPASATAKPNCVLYTRPGSLPAVDSCPPAAMAENDLFEWNRDIRNILPLGTGKIEAAGNVFTISITWDSDRNGSVNSNDPTFSASFQL